MKKALVALLAGFSLSAFAGSGTVDVVSNQAICVSALSGAGAAAWSTGVVTAAGTIMAVNGRPALCVVGGTNGTATFAIGGVDVASGAATWRECLAVRKALIVANDSTNKIYVGPDVAAGVGIPLAAGEKISWYGGDAQIARLYVISASETSAVSVVEW